jgi:exodeoxyribonuclease VII small subunit
MEPENYTVAFEELQQLISDMELGEIGVDDLAQKVKRASELIQYCRNKLKSTELDVASILKQLEEENDGTNA